MAFTKDEIYQAALNELSNYEALAEKVQIGDVTITQQIGAIAQMLAMISMQTDLGLTEYWTRARDSFVLADAAARQILPFGIPKIFKISVKNESSKQLKIIAGRRLLDQRSRLWVVRDGVSINANSSAEITAIQYDETTFNHTVDDFRSFYRIAIPEPNANQSLIDLKLTKVSNNQVLNHIEKFNNINFGDYVYHILADEYLNMYIQFGLKNKAGYVPSVGEQFHITLRQSYINFTIELGSQFSLEYTEKDEELLSFYATEEMQVGEKPATVTELRELVKYPYLYDENAVFLGEFSQLIARKMRPFVFLSVWNEFTEEAVRGANVKNINKLFVSFIKDNVSITEAQKQIETVIKNADSSYKIEFISTKEILIQFSVNLWLSPLHDSAAVQKKVQLWILNQFGKQSNWARRGRQRINVSDITKKLKESVIELNDGSSDVVISVVDPNIDLPEAFRYVSESSLSIKTTAITSD